LCAIQRAAPRVRGTYPFRPRFVPIDNPAETHPRDISMKYVAAFTAAVLISGVVAANAQSSGAGMSGTKRNRQSMRAKIQDSLSRYRCSYRAPKLIGR
jgi:hypothetical protein